MSDNHYVDNIKLQEEMIIFIAGYKKAQIEEGVKRPKNYPPPSDYIGKCILLISRNLSSKGNFANYPFREDMVADGIENCLTYLYNYDPVKYSNPFTYLTTIIYYAFLRRIKLEKGHLHMKNSYGETQNIMSTGFAGLDGSNLNYDMHHLVVTDNHSDWDDAYREKTLENDAEKEYNKDSDKDKVKKVVKKNVKVKSKPKKVAGRKAKHSTTG